MPLTCCHCGKTARAAQGTTFHKFPLRKPQLLQLWLKNMQLGSDFKPLNSMRLCSDHFAKECLMKPGTNVQMREGSIPTLFGKYKSVCVYCSAIKTHGTQRSFHKFPIKNPLLLRKWLVAIGKENYLPSKNSLLCSDHFENSCYRSCADGSARRLRDTAVPSILKPVICEELDVPIRKRTGETLHEVPVTKHQRQDNYCESGMPRTNNVDCESNTLSSRNTVPTEITNQCQNSTIRNVENHIHSVSHDHQYENNPRATRRNLMASREKVKKLQQEVRIYKQKINRLYKRISSLKDIVSRSRAKALTDGISCSNSVPYDNVL